MMRNERNSRGRTVWTVVAALLVGGTILSMVAQEESLVVAPAWADPCGPGYAPANATCSFCLPCGVGSYQPSAECYDFNTTCLACNPGTHANSTAQASCASCPEGTFASGFGAVSCTPCAPGQFGDTTGATACTSCSPGSYSPPAGGATSCTPCAPDTHQPDPGQFECDPCPPGFEQPLPGQTSCLPSTPEEPQRKCWKVKDLRNPPFSKVLGQQADDEFRNEDVDLKKPFMVCAPVDTGGGIDYPEAFECCYKVKADKMDPRPSIEIEGALGGTIEVELKKPFVLCEPCTRSAIP